MQPSKAIHSKSEASRGVMRRFRGANIWISNSVLHGMDAVGSDLSMLVEPASDTTLFDLCGVWVSRHELPSVSVGLRTPRGLSA